MKPTCFSCSGGELAVECVEQQPGQRQDGVQRRAELMAHIGQEARLEFVGAAQMIGLLVELRIERDHAAIGVFQLAVQLRQFFLAVPQFVESGEQFAVLVRSSSIGSCRQLPRDRGARWARARRRLAGAPRRAALRAALPGAAVGRGLDIEPVHQPLRADNAEPMPVRELVAPSRMVGRSRMPGP